MTEVDHPVFDCDNHYYEALDAFTRHLDPALGPRCVQWSEIEGRRYQVVGGVVSRAVTNPTFDPIAKPGAMHDYFRGNPEGRNPLEFLADREPIRASYRNRDARLAEMDEQGLDKCWLFPTLGMLYEELLKDDPDAVCLTFEAFNRWLLDDWGFAYQDRIFAGPYISLADVDWAVRELEWALDHDARTIVMRTGTPTTAEGRKNPFDEYFDRFWGLADEAGITVVVHAGDAGLSANGWAPDGFAASFKGGYRPSIKQYDIERAAHDWLISTIFANLFGRFPNLRIASVENGAEFLPQLLKKLTSMHRRIPGFYPEDPADIFRRHVWINPFWEDDVYEIVETMGADRVLFGSDWPHIEGLPSPLDYVVEVKELSASDRRKVLVDNVSELNERTPA